MFLASGPPYHQLLHSVPDTVDTGMPEPAASFFSILDLSSLNPLDIFAGECVNEGLGKFDTRVVMSTLGVLGLCVLNW